MSSSFSQLPCQFNIRPGWLLTCMPEQPCLFSGFWERQALWAVPKSATARQAKHSCCCKALAAILPLILCTMFPERYWPEVFCGLCGQVERNTETEVWKKCSVMITLCSENNTKKKKSSLYSGRESQKWETNLRIWARVPIFIYGREKKTCNIYVYIYNIYLELLGYSGCLTARDSLAFVPLGARKDVERWTNIWWQQRRTIFSPLPFPARHSSLPQVLPDIYHIALHCH